VGSDPRGDGGRSAPAQSELETVASRLQQQYPDTNRGWSIRLQDLKGSEIPERYVQQDRHDVHDLSLAPGEERFNLLTANDQNSVAAHPRFSASI